MNKYMWCENDSTFAPYNRNTKTASIRLFNCSDNGTVGRYSLMSFTNLMPLYSGIATKEQARMVVDTYLNSDHFICNYGVRTLSSKSEYYNNAVWGNPPRFELPERLTNSNWQGPVWFPNSYFVLIALMNYGYKVIAKEIADKIINTLANDIIKNGYMHENYHAETGEPLYATEFASWNLLADLLEEYLRTGESVTDLYMPKI